jgi:arsenate reductase
MNENPHNVLFLCTANSARSVMAEALMNRLGRGRFRAFSAGSHPAGAVNPIALDLLKRLNFDTASLRSKSWDEFAEPGAPKLDFVFTVCDKAAAEVCPIWPGQPMTAHWGFADPAAFAGSAAEKAAVFAQTFREIGNRIQLFLSLPSSRLSKVALQRELDRIGNVQLALTSATDEAS